MFVRNWMSGPAVVIPPDVPATAALSFMEKRKIRRLPVVREGKLEGIVTQSDLYALTGREKRSRRGVDKSVGEVMTRKPITVSPGDTLERAAQVMMEKKISGLPVVEDGKVVGIITESDVFRALCEMMGVGEKGARIVMTIADEGDLLGTIRERLDGLALRSLATYHNPGRKRWEVVLRVRGRVPAAASGP